jgi:hypothetical protein
MYSELAPWFHLLTAPEDYGQEAEDYRLAIVEAADGPVETLLELGSGGGNNASHLKHHFRCTLTDLSPEMLVLSRTINPECEHIEGDMRTLRLGRTFDAVFVHDAIGYLITAEDIRSAAATAFVHTRPGGVAVITPDCVRETFAPETDCGGHDDPSGAGVRYLEWTHPADPAETAYHVDYAILVRDSDGSVTVHHDHHVIGLFSTAEWLEMLGSAGYEVRAVDPGEGHDNQLMFVCRRGGTRHEA